MNQENTAVTQIDLAHLIAAFRRGFRRLWLPALLVIVLLAGTMGFRSWRSYRPVYTASATFAVYVGSELQSSTPTYNAAAAEQMSKTFPFILTSGVLSEVIKADLNLPALPAIQASAVEGANLFELRVSGSDPQQCYDVLQSVIENSPSVAEFVVGPTTLSIVDESGVPTKPANGRLWRSSAERGALIGLVLSVAAMFLYGWAKATIMGREDMETSSNARYLGVLPRVTFKRRSGDAPVISVRSDGNRSYREAFRTVMVRLKQSLKSHHYKALVVTSAIPGEGKTTVAFNLALSLTEKDKRVILVDCDLRNPSVYQMTGQEPCAGLGECLRGEIDLKKDIRSVIHKVEGEDSLEILYAGEGGSTAPELLGSEIFAALMMELRKTYDYVVLDTPPCSLLSDVSELQGVADCAVLVVRQNFSSKNSVLGTLTMLSEYEIPVAGYIINAFNGRISGGHGYGYGYGYGHGYGYGYGYGKKYDQYGAYGERSEKDTAGD